MLLSESLQNKLRTMIKIFKKEERGGYGEVESW